MMAIEMVGGVYCPLSPRDPQHRLLALVKQTQSHLVLVHYCTNTIFDDNIASVDINSVVTSHSVQNNADLDRLSNVLVTSENIAYIIFTSGSTGTPKPVSNKVKTVIKRLSHPFS